MNDRDLTTMAVLSSGSLDLAVVAWLDAHGKQSKPDGIIEHTRTSKAYEQTITLFRAGLRGRGLDLDSDPGKVALLAQAFAGSSARGKPVKSTTKNQRLATLSSFYEFARKRGFLEQNPIAILDREKVQEYAHAEALDDETVSQALQKIDQSTLRGARDYAILSVYLQTGRRAQEVSTLQWQHVHLLQSSGKAKLTFEHAKGNEVMQDELPARVTNALLRWLHQYYGAELDRLALTTPLWVSLAHDTSYGQALGYQSINALCKKWLEFPRCMSPAIPGRTRWRSSAQVRARYKRGSAISRSPLPGATWLACAGQRTAKPRNWLLSMALSESYKGTETHVSANRKEAPLWQTRQPHRRI